MPKREVDKRKTRKALRRLQRASERAGQEGAPELTNWEKDFVEGVTKRLETYGSAFRDPGKGRLEEALSARQHHITRVIDKKSRPQTSKAKAEKTAKTKSGAKKYDKPDVFRGSSLQRKSTFKSKGAPLRGPRVRDVNDDLNEELAAPPTAKRAAFKVIDGGKPAKKPPGKPA